MSCGCENRRLAGEIDRMRRLAKGLAGETGQTVVIYGNTDGTYCIGPVGKYNDRTIIEYITPY